MSMNNTIENENERIMKTNLGLYTRQIKWFRESGLNMSRFIREAIEEKRKREGL